MVMTTAIQLDSYTQEYNTIISNSNRSFDCTTSTSTEPIQWITTSDHNFNYEPEYITFDEPFIKEITEYITFDEPFIKEIPKTDIDKAFEELMDIL